MCANADKLLDGSFAAALEPQGGRRRSAPSMPPLPPTAGSSTLRPAPSLDAPIELQNVQAGGQTHVRLPVRVGRTAPRRPSSSARPARARRWSRCRISVGDGAEVRWLIVQDQPDDASHLGQFNAGSARTRS
jgi:Fe-S cluster assembly protein SufD